MIGEKKKLGIRKLSIEAIKGGTGNWVRIGSAMLTAEEALVVATRAIEAVNWLERRALEIKPALKVRGVEWQD